MKHNFSLRKLRKFVKALRSGKYTKITYDWYGDKNNCCFEGVCIAELSPEIKSYSEECWTYSWPNVGGPNNYSQVATNLLELDSKKSLTGSLIWFKVPPFLASKYGVEPDREYVGRQINDHTGMTFEEMADCLEYTYGNKECILEKHKKQAESSGTVE